MHKVRERQGPSSKKNTFIKQTSLGQFFSIGGDKLNSTSVTQPKVIAPSVALTTSTTTAVTSGNTDSIISNNDKGKEPVRPTPAKRARDLSQVPENCLYRGELSGKRPREYYLRITHIPKKSLPTEAQIKMREDSQSDSDMSIDEREELANVKQEHVMNALAQIKMTADSEPSSMDIDGPTSSSNPNNSSSNSSNNNVSNAEATITSGENEEDLVLAKQEKGTEELYELSDEDQENSEDEDENTEGKNEEDDNMPVILLENITLDECLPDLICPSFYCRTCSKQKSSKQEYSYHLKKVHKLTVQKPPTRPTCMRYPNILPNVNNPDNFCRTCEKTYVTKARYRAHLRVVHHYELSPLCGNDKYLPDILPDEDDPNNYCRACKVYKPTKLSYREHLRHYHKMKLRNLRFKKPIPPELMPEVDDPNFYCRACKITKTSRKEYRAHLRDSHDMTLPSMIRGPNANKELSPDPEDPNYYCRSCDVRYGAYSAFRGHMRRSHAHVYEPLISKSLTVKNPNMLPDIYDPNYWCRSCEIKKTTLAKYRDHCRKIHRMKFEPIKGGRKPFKTNGLPDLYDPNFYCRVCKVTKRDRYIYRQHCADIHDMEVGNGRKGPNPRPDLKPDPSDPRFYCRTCDLIKQDLSCYRHHLRAVHKDVVLPPLQRKTYLGTPDPEDPDFYCSVCKLKTSTKGEYFRHLRTTHAMKVGKESLINVKDPNILPDPFDPNFYCCSCKKTYSGKVIFRKHCRNTHKMKLVPLVGRAKIFPNTMPDPNDPNFFCSVCAKKKPSLQNFRQHLKKVHAIVFKDNVPVSGSLSFKFETGTKEPPPFSCSSCSITFDTQQEVNDHLLQVHKIDSLYHFQVKNPNVLPDYNSRDNYCPSCEKTYSNRRVYLNHIKTIHNIVRPEEQAKRTRKRRGGPLREEEDEENCEDWRSTTSSTEEEKEEELSDESEEE